MEKIKVPTYKELFNKELELVHRETDDGWRHGCYVFEVYKREEDDTFWAVNYILSTDGETNGLRDELCNINQVKPQEEIKTVYVLV